LIHFYKRSNIYVNVIIIKMLDYLTSAYESFSNLGPIVSFNSWIRENISRSNQNYMIVAFVAVMAFHLCYTKRQAQKYVKAAQKKVK